MDQVQPSSREEEEAAGAADITEEVQGTVVVVGAAIRTRISSRRSTMYGEVIVWGMVW